MAVDFVFLDSGTGGIPYMLHLLKKSPDSKCVYVGDTANFPYGNKTHEEVVKCVIDVVGKIIQRFNPKVIVLACNTMSVNALDVVRSIYPDNTFVGTVPAIKLASETSKNRRIGLMATKSTIEHPYNQDLKNHFASDCELVLQPAPDLISFIEHEAFTASKEECIKAIEPSVEFFRKNNCDCIILGCTHFLNLADLIQEVAGEKIKVVDSVEGVVNRALSVIGALRGVPAEGVAEKTAGCAEDFGAQGKAFPSFNTLYVTGFTDKKDENEYNVICKRFNLSFGGKL